MCTAGGHLLCQSLYSGRRQVQRGVANKGMYPYHERSCQSVSSCSRCSGGECVLLRYYVYCLSVLLRHPPRVCTPISPSLCCFSTDIPRLKRSRPAYSSEGKRAGHLHLERLQLLGRSEYDDVDAGDSRWW